MKHKEATIQNRNPIKHFINVGINFKLLKFLLINHSPTIHIKKDITNIKNNTNIF